MKLSLALAATLVIAGLSASSPSLAQVIPASQVLADCPDVPQAQACPPLAAEFLGSKKPSARRDAQIVELVVAIAEAAQQPRVPRRSCLNAADGLRVLATGVTTDEQEQQIIDIADALCVGSRTASVGRRPFFLFDSLSGTSNGAAGGNSATGGTGSSGQTPGGGTTPPTGCVSNCNPGPNPTGATGLGSNNAATNPNQNALDNANENATNNTNGQNGESHGKSEDAPGQTKKTADLAPESITDQQTPPVTESTEKDKGEEKTTPAGSSETPATQPTTTQPDSSKPESPGKSESAGESEGKGKGKPS